MIASLIDKAAYVIFFAFIARKLSQADFGAYNLTLTLLTLIFDPCAVPAAQSGEAMRDVEPQGESAREFAEPPIQNEAGIPQGPTPHPEKRPDIEGLENREDADPVPLPDRI